MTYDKKSQLLYRVIGDEIWRVLRSRTNETIDAGIMDYLQLLSWLQLEVVIQDTSSQGENDDN